MSGDDHCMEKSGSSEYVGLLPAAGVGSRLPDRQLSKELLQYGDTHGTGRPVISHLLSCMRQAGITDVTVVLRQGKEDIREHLAGSEWHDINIAYEMTAGTSGVPETVALGLSRIRSSPVAFGFPDILFEPCDAFTGMMRRLENSDADVVLGLFPTDNPKKMDMVGVDATGRVTGIEIKPEHTSLDLTWILAVWNATFSKFLGNIMHTNPARISALAASAGDGHLGHAFQLAIADGLKIDAESFPHGKSLDIGTPEDLHLARSWPD
jgi:glucose-1-phosphate thymidylyltransferase